MKTRSRNVNQILVKMEALVLKMIVTKKDFTAPALKSIKESIVKHYEVPVLRIPALTKEPALTAKTLLNAFVKRDLMDQHVK